MARYVIEVSSLIMLPNMYLWGHLEAAMVSWATKTAIRDNIHMDTGVIKDANFKSEVKFDL